MPYIVGLTGNIGTGKSTVAAFLRELGAEVVDADAVVHELMVPHTPEWERIVDRFGPEVLRPDETIDRSRLGALVFGDPGALSALEAILHPAVRQRIRARIAASERPIVVVEAIKLLESGLYLECDAVWVVTADRAAQLERLMRTRGMAAPDAELRIDAQAPQPEKVRRADVVIENSGDVGALRERLSAAWQAAASGTAPSRRGQER